MKIRNEGACARFQQEWLSRQRPGGDSLTPAAEDHVRGCDACAEALRSGQRLRDGLRALAEEDRAVGASPRVEAALLRKFREKHGVAEPLVVARRSRPWMIPSAMAAALLLAAVLAWRPMRQDRAIAGSSPSAGVPQVSMPEAPAAAESSPHAAPAEMARATNPRAACRTSRPQGAAEPPGAFHEVATDFIPLVYGEVLDPAERAQLLRVNVPRAVMRSAGLPVREERLEERVPADVLLGEDGTPRAIRFVSLASHRQ